MKIYTMQQKKAKNSASEEFCLTPNGTTWVGYDPYPVKKLHFIHRCWAIPLGYSRY